MKNTSKTSITLAAVTALGLSLFASQADAQGWGRSSSNQWGNNGYSQNSRGARDQNSSLKRDAYTLDQLANQMISQFSRDLRYNRGCRESIALLNHMRNYTGLTRNLVNASNGTCPDTFKKAACAARDTLTGVQNQSKRVPNLSCSVKSLIDQSCPIATRIHQGSNRFSTPSSYTSSQGLNRAPVNVSRSRQVNQNPYISLFSSFLRAANR